MKEEYWQNALQLLDAADKRKRRRALFFGGGGRLFLQQ